jgi:hypothetical protein
MGGVTKEITENITVSENEPAVVKTTKETTKTDSVEKEPINPKTKYEQDTNLDPGTTRVFKMVKLVLKLPQQKLLRLTLHMTCQLLFMFKTSLKL